MLKFKRDSWSSFFKMLLLAISFFGIFIFLSHTRNDTEIPINVIQENRRVFHQSFLDKSQSLCDGRDGSFLDKKSFVSRHCQVKLYEAGDVATCLDSLTAAPSADAGYGAKYDSRAVSRSLLVREADRKQIQFIFVGDSRIRGLFTDFVRVLPDYDLQYEPPIISRIQKFHIPATVTSSMLNIRVSFISELFFTNNTKRTFENWIESSEKGVIQAIVVGISLHHIVHLQYDMSHYDTFKNGLIEIEPVLRRLATKTKVIWLKQYTVIDDPFKANFCFREFNHIIYIRRSISNFNSLSASILRNSGVAIWDTGDFMVEEYIRSCHIQMRSDVDSARKPYFICPDLLHPGYAAQYFALQLFLNEMCYELRLD